MVADEDTEGGDHFGQEIEVLMDILGIERSDGLLSFYLGGLWWARTLSNWVSTLSKLDIDRQNQLPKKTAHQL